MARLLKVRYRREETAPESGRSLALLPEKLATLPEELRAELRSAVVSLNGDRLTRAIEAVTALDAGLGAALARCADNYAYSAILSGIDAVHRQ
jgi:hypothetical protein